MAQSRKAETEARPVLIDTCIWAPYFSRRTSPTHEVIDDLADRGLILTTGVIVAEVLAGIHRSEEADWIASQLKKHERLEVTWDIWIATSQLCRQLARVGRKLPLPDLVIASVAIDNGCAVYTTDPHFDYIPELSRYYPD